MIEPTVAAYAAGLIDGDGCIQVNKKKRIGWDYHSITVSVSQVSEDAVNWMFRNFGGRVNKFFSSKERRQPIYRWSADCKQAGFILQAILPFLVQKAERAKLAIQLQEMMKPVYGHNGVNAIRMKPSEDELFKRESLFVQMKAANKSFGRNHWTTPVREGI